MRAKAIINKTGRSFLALALALGLSPFMLVTGVSEAYAGTVESFSGTADASSVTITVPVATGNKWYDQTQVAVDYDNGGTAGLVLEQKNGTPVIYYNWNRLTNAEVAFTAESDTSGYYVVTIPLSVFASNQFTLTANGVSVTSAELGIGTAQSGSQGGSDDSGSGSQGDSGGSDDGSQGGTTTPPADAVYNGIVIDGSFDDWAAVTKYPGNDPNGNIDEAAMVFDGDWVYLYISEIAGKNGAYNAGPYSNGKYEILADLGERTLIQLNFDGTTSGIDGAQAVHNGTRWEIAVPASALPAYNQTISFGLYQWDSMVADVANLNGQGSGGTFAGIVYDGLFGDWTYYPHHIIEYATAGTSEYVEDASGALYQDGSTLYGHVKTNMQQHLNNSNGGEFTQGVTIRFNNDENFDFNPYLVMVDESGNINWWPQLENLENGTYEFYIASRDAWHTSANINNLNEHDQMYGKMTVSVSDQWDECEFYLDLDKLAERFGCNVNDFRISASQFIRIGDEWVVYAGTSTAPFVGIGLSVATVLGVLGVRRLKGDAASADNVAAGPMGDEPRSEAAGI